MTSRQALTLVGTEASGLSSGEERNDMLRHPRVAAFLRRLPFIIVAVNLFLVFTGVVNIAQAALLVLALEASLFVVVIAGFTTMRVAFRKARSRGASRIQALLTSLDTCLPPVVASVIRQELLVFMAIPGFFRRASQDEGTTTLRSSGPALSLSTVLLVFTVPGSVVCLLFVGGPSWLPWVLFGVLLYFAVYALGLRALYSTTVHSVDRQELRLRHGATVDLRFPLSRVSSVHGSEEAHRGRAVHVVDDSLTISLFGRTNVVVEFGAPAAVEFFDRAEQDVTCVRFFADEPEVAVAAIETHMSAHPHES